MADDKYVTYKWLIGSMLSTLGIVVSFMGIVSYTLDKRIDSKVSLDVDTARHLIIAQDMDEMKRTLKSNGMKLDTFGINQILVMRALGIKPVTSENNNR